MIQLQAGYILDSVKEKLFSQYDKDRIGRLLYGLSFFDVEIVSKKNVQDPVTYPFLLVAENIISRGLPTRPPLAIEEKLTRAFLDMDAEFDKDAREIGTLKFDVRATSSFIEKVFRALHIIEPRITKDAIIRAVDDKVLSGDGAFSDSAFEREFFEEKLPEHASECWMQLIEMQRSVESIMTYANSWDGEPTESKKKTSFSRQKVDFSIEFPYPLKGENDQNENDKYRKGIIIEIDGGQHKESVQRTLDNKRNKALEMVSVETLRIPTDAWGRIGAYLNRFSVLEESECFRIIRENYENPLYVDDECHKAMQLALIPFAVARIEKTVLHMLNENILDISAKEWNVAVVERDVECAAYAFVELKVLLQSLIGLSGSDIKLPKLRLYIDGDVRFGRWYDMRREYRRISYEKEYDLLLDCAILERGIVSLYDKRIRAKNIIAIRSSKSIHSNRTFHTDTNIVYRPIGEMTEDEMTKDSCFKTYSEQEKRLELGT